MGYAWIIKIGCWACFASENIVTTKLYCELNNIGDFFQDEAFLEELKCLSVKNLVEEQKEALKFLEDSRNEKPLSKETKTDREQELRNKILRGRKDKRNSRWSNIDNSETGLDENIKKGDDIRKEEDKRKEDDRRKKEDKRKKEHKRKE